MLRSHTITLRIDHIYIPLTSEFGFHLVQAGGCQKFFAAQSLTGRLNRSNDKNRPNITISRMPKTFRSCLLSIQTLSNLPIMPSAPSKTPSQDLCPCGRQTPRHLAPAVIGTLLRLVFGNEQISTIIISIWVVSGIEVAVQYATMALYVGVRDFGECGKLCLQGLPLH